MRLKKNRQRIFPKAPRKLYCKDSTILGNFNWSITSFEKGSLGETVNNDLNRCKNGQSILCDTHLGPPSFWTSSMKG